MSDAHIGTMVTRKWIETGGDTSFIQSVLYKMFHFHCTRTIAMHIFARETTGQFPYMFV